jgi:hypothetical protein
MKKLLAFCLVTIMFKGLMVPVRAQEPTVVSEAEEATSSAEVTPIPKKPALTEPIEEVVGPLEMLLKEQKVRPLSVDNFLKHAVRRAVSVGVPPNTIVLIFLFPLIAALIAAARHYLGIAGFGIFTPAMISVAFLATGIVSGLIIFLVTLLMATVARLFLKKFKVHYLPRMAILLWFICLGIFVVIFAFPTVSIFPILFMILLVENFIEVQTGRSMREAIGLTAETLLIAVACYALLNWKFLQSFALLNPEILVVGVFLFNLIVGRYTGFRIFEYQRFKPAMKR